MSIPDVMNAASKTAPTRTDPAKTDTKKSNPAIKTGLDYNAFLQLLIAQIKNQDPLSPMDPTAQMSQLASFSNVEQTIKLNQKLETMITVSSLTQADSLIGRTLTSADGKTTGTVKSVQVNTDGTIATLTSGAKIILVSGVKVA